ncbi:MAG: TolC family protein [Terriglobia bacterium]|jgi:cobalt-zinc-cadmium efflux system outer membrane protein
MKKLAWLMLALLGGIPSVQAQQPPRLTLQEALDLADKQNLDLAAARRQRAVALAGIQIAKERPNPTANFTALRDEPHEGLFFDQPIEIGGKRGRRIEVARQEGAVTEVEIATLARQVRKNTRETYYAAAYARAESERLARVVGLAKRLEQIAKDRFNAGDVAQLEVLQSGLERSRAEADLEVARQREVVSLSELNAHLNEPATKPWELAGTLEDATPTARLDDLVGRAYQSNPDLQHLGGEKKVEDSRRSLLKAERVPDLVLDAGIDFNAPRDFRYGPRSQVSMNLPIFSRNQGEIAQSIANSRVLDAETAATERSVSARVESAFYDLEAQRTQVRLYHDRLLPVARQLESLAEESYRAGKTGILTAIQAQQDVQSVESSYLQSLEQLQSLYADLEDTVGGPVE